MFQKGHEPHPNAGRPQGSETQVRVPKVTQRKIIRQLAASAESGDKVSAEILAMLMLRGVA